MEDPLLQQRCRRHLEQLIELAEKETERTREWGDVNFLSWMYKRLFEEALDVYVNRCRCNLLQAFKEFADQGYLELITCAGTHGYLPMLRSEPATVKGAGVLGSAGASAHLR